MAGGYTFSRIGIRRYTNPLPSAVSISPGRSGRDQLEQHVARLHGLQAVAQELRVEADLERLAAERHRQRLARLADVRRPRRHGQLALAERQSQRRVLLRQQADAADDVGDLRPGQLQLVLERVREQLAVVRELPVDQPRGQDHPADLEDDLVRPHRDAQRLRLGLADDPAELLQRPRRHVRLERAGERLLELRLLDGQPVGVGRDHPQLGAVRRDQDPGQHRAGLVAGGRARHLVDGGDERRTGDLHALVAVGLRERREVLERAACGCGTSRRRRRSRRPARRDAARASRSRRAASGRRRRAAAPAARRIPSRTTSPSSGTRSPISMSVARSSMLPSPAITWTPERAWTALRVLAARVTVWSCANNASRWVESLISSPASDSIRTTTQAEVTVIRAVDGVHNRGRGRTMRGNACARACAQDRESLAARAAS